MFVTRVIETQMQSLIHFIWHHRTETFSVYILAWLRATKKIDLDLPISVYSFRNTEFWQCHMKNKLKQCKLVSSFDEFHRAVGVMCPPDQNVILWVQWVAIKQRWDHVCRAWWGQEEWPYFMIFLSVYFKLVKGKWIPWLGQHTHRHSLICLTATVISNNDFEAAQG